MDFIQRISQPKFRWFWGGIPGLGVLIAVIGFGAPLWIFIPVWWATMILHGHVAYHARRRSGRFPLT